MIKKTILIDLDGVLNSYDGIYEEDYIPPIREGAFEFVKNLSVNYRLVLFTSRNLLLASRWLMENKLDKYIENVTNIKEPAYLIIDDRCINFQGNYDKIFNKIINYKAWYKK